MRGDLARKLLARCLAAGLAVLAFLTLALTAATGWGLALTTGAVAAAWVERRIRPKAELVAESVLLAAGVVVAYARQLPAGFHWTLALTAAVLLGLILVERPLRDASALEIRSANLDVRSLPLLVTANLGTGILILLTGLAASAAAGLPTWPGLAATLLLGGVGAGALLALARRRLKPSAARSPIGRALRRHRPEFLLYFSAPPGSEYQVTMWLPYLERIGRPFIVVLREPEFLPSIAAATRAPVVLCPTLSALDEAIVPSLRVAFYVNHGAKNSHCVRFPQLTHIQIHHGDSDKAPSANPMSAIFDKIFVAGQAAIDRYARAGVVIPREKFVIVGRPQVESIQVTTERVRDAAEQVVLYTPTWTGHYSDANYCSLGVGEALVKQLLARGVTVILRAHPYTSQNPESARQLARLEELLAAERARTGRQHVWGAQAAVKMTLVDCVNRSHALVSDVSGVISDYLYSGKPYAVTDMVGEAERFVETFPLARAGYVLRRDMSNVESTLALLLDEDPLEPVRRQVRSEYLGDFPADSYAEGFLSAARAFLEPDGTQAGASPAPVEPTFSPATR